MIPQPTVLNDGLAFSREEFAGEFQGEIRNQIMVSVSFRGKRPSDWQCKRALELNGLPTDIEEDNHLPGITRSFFWVEGVENGVCECKTDETVVVEPDGYVWSKTKELEGFYS